MPDHALVGAEEALRIGLVDRLAEDPEAAALDLAEGIAGLHPGAAARVKGVVARAAGARGALALEAAGNQGWRGALEHA